MEINTTPSLHAAEPDGSDSKVKDLPEIYPRSIYSQIYI